MNFHEFLLLQPPKIGKDPCKKCHFSPIFSDILVNWNMKNETWHKRYFTKTMRQNPYQKVIMRKIKVWFFIVMFWVYHQQ